MHLYCQSYGMSSLYIGFTVFIFSDVLTRRVFMEVLFFTSMRVFLVYINAQVNTSLCMDTYIYSSV